MRLAILIALVWALLVGGYLLLAGTLDAVEILLSLVCGSLGAALGIAMSRIAKLNFSLRFAPKVIVNPMLAVPADFYLTGRQLFRAAMFGTGGEIGQPQHQPFNPAELNARTATRRAASLIGISFTPRTFMVRREDDHLLLHSMPANTLSDDADWPV